MTNRLGQSDFEDLTAYFDGQLDVQRTAEIERLVNGDATWRDELRAMQAVDRALDLLDVPQTPAGLAGRIAANVRQAARPTHIRLVRWLAPLAVAAAVVLAAVIYHHQANQTSSPNTNIATNNTPATGGTIGDPLAGVAIDDQFTVENLEFFNNYEVVNNFDTLQAIDRLETNTGS